MKNQDKHLYRLEELSDYKIASGYPDVRGWVVKDRDHRLVGSVKGLLANVTLEKVLYLDVEVDQGIIDAGHDPYAPGADGAVREFINEKGENHIIIPIGMANFNEDRQYVYTAAIDHRTFTQTRRRNASASLEREYEMAVLDTYGRGTGTRLKDSDRAGYSEDDFYNRSEFDDSRFRNHGSKSEDSRR